MKTNPLIAPTTSSLTLFVIYKMIFSWYEFTETLILSFFFLIIISIIGAIKFKEKSIAFHIRMGLATAVIFFLNFYFFIIVFAPPS